MITNCYGKAKASRLEGRSTTVFRATDWTESYSHHPQITSVNGNLLATWSLGKLHEDGPGQRMVMATSDDLGKTWSAPVTVVAAGPGEHRQVCITSGGIHLPPEDGLLTAYYTSYDHTLEGLLSFYETGAHMRWATPVACLQDVFTGILQSTDGGATWTRTDSRIPGFITNLSPVRLSSGRLIITSHRTNAWTDDQAGVVNWKISPLPGLPENYYEGAAGDLKIDTDWNNLGICEGSVYEVPGKPLRLLSRTSKGRLAFAESHDNGESWTSTKLSEFTDCGARFQFGRLTDGRCFALSCPNADMPEALLRRTPLVMAVSEDGDKFDRHYIIGDAPDMPLRYPGAYKHGRYGYPYLHVSDDRLYIINSVGKEDVELHVFDIKDLD
ncbi:MAG: sialidase family protein [Candidatus Methylacidiphilales bacterium]|nr:sialidase family protein [Candidatus Methylacidiphilales bacterium]